MKSLLLLPLVVLPALFVGCEAVVVDERPVRRSAYVEREVTYRDGRDYRDPRYRDVRDSRYDGYGRRDTRRQVVVVDPRPNYTTSSQVQVRYYNDTRGRYYIRDGRRIYSTPAGRYDAQFNDR